jgi:ABC-type Mn2+/Zn2+ transport system permease subunit
MAILAALVGALSAPTGLFAAFAYDLPAGPAIVLAATGFFILSAVAARLIRR